MGVMELRRLGLVRKPCIAVPNHMLEQFSREFLQLYPQAKILVTQKEDLQRDRRRLFIGRIATGDWDAVIIGHAAFERISLSADAIQAYMDREVKQIRDWLEQVKDSEGRLTVKRLEAMLLAAEERLKAKIAAAAKDPGVTFENTGLDYLCIDEAHLFKNLRTMSSIPGAAIDGSMRASDLDMKLQWLREHRGRRVTTLATATPIANSVTEAHVMQRYLQPELLQILGISDFDSWAGTFGQTVTEIELAPEGGTSFRQVTRFAKFQNVPEMLRLFFAAADIKTSEDLQLPVPAIAVRADGQRAPETVQVDPSDGQEAFIITLGSRAEAIRNGNVKPDEDNMVSVCTDGRMAALDMRLLGQPMDVPGKIGAAAGKIAAIWQAHRDDVYPGPDGQPHPVRGSLQIVFCDLGTPRDRWNVYDELRAQLVARGLPRQAVRFIHEAATDQAKGELFAACRAGNVAVLVGTTAKMGVGTNVQARAVALHHLDAPWRPADVAQREGRILRQGNLNAEVQIIRYVTERSFDGYMWQTLERKAKFIAQIMRGRLDVREIEDIGDAALSYNEVKALATGNPLLIDKAEADAELTKLDRAERAHHRNEDYLQRTITRGRNRAAEIGDLLPRLDQAIARRRDTRAEAFAMTVDGRTYRKRPDAGLQLKGLLQKEAAAVATEVKARGGSTRGRTIPVGELGGLALAADIYPAFGDIRITLHYPDAPGTDLALTLADLAKADPAGLAVQLENRLRGLEKTRTDLAAEQDQASAEADRAAAATGKPFPQAGKLAAARARVQEITEQLEAIAAEQTGRPGQETGTDPDAAAAGAETPAASPSGQPAASSRRPAPASPGAAAGGRESRPRHEPAHAGHGPAESAGPARHGSPQAAAETAAPGPPAREGAAAPAAGPAPARGRGPAQDRPAARTGTAPEPGSRPTSAAAPARYEQSWPPGQAQEALDDAAARAARTRQVHYVYTRNNHWVCASREPPGAAWYAVNPHGSWARRIHGQTEAFDGQPTPLHLSALGAEPAGAAAGPAGQPFAGDWTGTHQFAEQISDMRRAALDNELLLHTAQSNGEDNFTTAFHRWADDYVAGGVPADPGQSPQFTRFATAYFDDLSFAADLTATLARQVYLAHTGASLTGSAQADAGAAAARAAARAWQAQIQARRASDCGCRNSTGCRDCRLPRDQDAAATRAAAIDIRLSRTPAAPSPGTRTPAPTPSTSPAPSAPGTSSSRPQATHTGP